MVRQLEDDEIDEILEQMQGSYYWMDIDPAEAHEIKFLSPITITEQGEEDLAGRTWDNDWPLFQVEAMVDGQKVIFGLQKSLLQKIKYISMKEGIVNSQLPFSYWTMTREGSSDWIVKFEGKEKEIPDESQKTLEEDTEEESEKKTKEEPEETSEDEYETIVKAFNELKEDYWTNEEDMPMDTVVVGLCTMTKMNRNKLEPYLEEMEENDIIEIDGDNIIL